MIILYTLFLFFVMNQTAGSYHHHGYWGPELFVPPVVIDPFPPVVIGPGVREEVIIHDSQCEKRRECLDDAETKAERKRCRANHPCPHN